MGQKGKNVPYNPEKSSHEVTSILTDFGGCKMMNLRTPLIDEFYRRVPHFWRGLSRIESRLSMDNFYGSYGTVYLRFSPLLCEVIDSYTLDQMFQTLVADFFFRMTFGNKVQFSPDCALGTGVFQPDFYLVNGTIV